MPGKFLGPEGDLEQLFVTDYAMIDQFAATGSLWAWGLNTSGQLGDNSATSKSSPVQTVSSGTNWNQVAAGTYHIASIKTDGTLWLWGNNGAGELGDNTRTNKSSPVQTVAGGTNWKQVAIGGSVDSAAFTGGIKTDGTLWLWGYNFDGQIGDNTVTSKSSPVQTVSGGTDWKLVACGHTHSGAIKTDGTLWMWGAGGFGQLGNNAVNNASSPVQTVSGGNNWRQVSCAYLFTAAIKTDGTLWTWGYNGDVTGGQLGDNTKVRKSSPVQTVAGGTNWKQVSCIFSHTAAIKTDGTLWLWGNNFYNSLGDTTSTEKSSPIQTVASGTNWKQVACGYGFTAAIKTDGTLWSWGRNNLGQLGDNSSTQQSSPVQTIAGGTNWKQVSCAQYHMAAIHFYDANNLYPNS